MSKILVFFVCFVAKYRGLAGTSPYKTSPFCKGDPTIKSPPFLKGDLGGFYLAGHEINATLQ